MPRAVFHDGAARVLVLAMPLPPNLESDGLERALVSSLESLSNHSLGIRTLAGIMHTQRRSHDQQALDERRRDQPCTRLGADLVAHAPECRPHKEREHRREGLLVGLFKVVRPLGVGVECARDGDAELGDVSGLEPAPDEAGLDVRHNRDR